MYEEYDPAAARMAIPGMSTAIRKKPTLGSLEGMPEDLGYEELNAQDLTEQEIAELASLGVLGDDLTENARQMELAEKLRHQAAPAGIQGNRVYTAASPLEHLGTGLERYQASKKIKGLEKERKDIGKKQTEGRGKYWDVLRGRRRKPQDIDVKMPTL